MSKKKKRLSFAAGFVIFRTVRALPVCDSTYFRNSQFFFAIFAALREKKQFSAKPRRTQSKKRRKVVNFSSLMETYPLPQFGFANDFLYRVKNVLNRYLVDGLIFDYLKLIRKR